MRENVFRRGAGNETEFLLCAYLCARRKRNGRMDGERAEKSRHRLAAEEKTAHPLAAFCPMPVQLCIIGRAYMYSRFRGSRATGAVAPAAATMDKGYEPHDDAYAFVRRRAENR